MGKTIFLLLTITLSTLPVWGTPSQADVDKARKLLAIHSNEFFTFVEQKLRSGKDLAYWNEMRALSGLGRGFVSVEDSHVFAARDAARMDPDNPHVLTTYAIVLAYKRKTNVAQQVINRALKVAPQDARAHAAQALIEFVIGEEGCAMEEIQTAIKLNPNDADVNSIAFTVYRKSMDQDQAEAALDRWVKIKPTDTFALRNRAESARINKNYPQSLRDCRAAIALNPHYDDVWVVMIHTLINMKDYNGVIAEGNKFLDKSKATSPFAFTWERRGKAYATLKEFKKAISDYSTVIKIISPDKSDTKFNTSVIHLDPELQKLYLKSWLERVSLYSKIGEGQKALKDLDSLLAVRPDQASALLLRAQVNMSLKKYDAALIDLNKLIAIDSDVTEWYRIKAKLLRQMGREVDAKRVELKLQDVERFGSK